MKFNAGPHRKESLTKKKAYLAPLAHNVQVFTFSAVSLRMSVGSCIVALSCEHIKFPFTVMCLVKEDCDSCMKFSIWRIKNRLFFSKRDLCYPQASPKCLQWVGKPKGGVLPWEQRRNTVTCPLNRAAAGQNPAHVSQWGLPCWWGSCCPHRERHSW